MTVRAQRHDTHPGRALSTRQHITRFPTHQQPNVRDLHAEHAAPQARLLSHEREERLPLVDDATLSVVILEVLLNPLPLPLSRLELRSLKSRDQRRALRSEEHTSELQS